jgi:hypothetical protein
VAEGSKWKITGSCATQKLAFHLDDLDLEQEMVEEGAFPSPAKANSGQPTHKSKGCRRIKQGLSACCMDRCLRNIC